MKKILVDKEKAEEIKRLYESNVKVSEICSIFGLNSSVIYRVLKEYNAKIKTNSQAQRKYYHNSNFFKNPNVVNSYFAGFICADGYINLKKRNLVIQIKDTDIEVLNNFKKYMEAEEPILNVKYDNRSHVKLSIVDDIILSDLKDNFNIGQAKTHSYIPVLKIDSEECIKAFIRGITDGDGCVGSGVGETNYYIAWIGTKELMHWIYDNVKKFLDVGSPNIYKTKHDNIYRLRFTGRKQSTKIIEWLYGETPSDLMLIRKYKKFVFVV